MSLLNKEKLLAVEKVWQIYKKTKKTDNIIETLGNECKNRYYTNMIGGSHSMKIKSQKSCKMGISQQIQKQVGSNILVTFLVIAIVSIFMVRSTVMSAKENELTIESKAASYQLGDYFDQYKRMTEQLAVNPQIR